eukprot:1698129-Rhodomonas_salina.1
MPAYQSEFVRIVERNGSIVLHHKFGYRKGSADTYRLEGDVGSNEDPRQPLCAAAHRQYHKPDTFCRVYIVDRRQTSGF